MLISAFLTIVMIPLKGNSHAYILITLMPFNISFMVLTRSSVFLSFCFCNFLASFDMYELKGTVIVITNKPANEATPSCCHKSHVPNKIENIHDHVILTWCVNSFSDWTFIEIILIISPTVVLLRDTFESFILFLFKLILYENNLTKLI